MVPDVSDTDPAPPAARRSGRGRGGERARRRARAAPARRREPEDDRLHARDRRELRRHLPHRGDQARARHAVRRPRGHAEGGQHRRVRPRRDPAAARRSPVHAALLDPRGRVRRRRARAVRVDRDGRHGRADGLSDRGHGVRAARPGAAARWLAEAAAIESEHRAIARFAQGALGGEQKIPIDRSFAPWSIKTVAGMIDALEEAGIGFGRQGAAPGKFYDFPGDPTATGRPDQQRLAGPRDGDARLARARSAAIPPSRPSCCCGSPSPSRRSCSASTSSPASSPTTGRSTSRRSSTT